VTVTLPLESRPTPYDIGPMFDAYPFSENIQPPEPKYDLATDEVRALVGDFLRNEDGLPKSRLVGVIVESGELLSNAARWLECRVFDDAFGNDAKVMQELYGKVEKDSTWFVVLDKRKKLPVGVMRAVGGESAFGMTLAEAPDLIRLPKDVRDPDRLLRDYHGIKPTENIWDVATVAIEPEYRGKISGQVAVMGMLERMFFREAGRRGITKMLALLDIKALRGLTSIGVPLHTLYGPQKSFPYAGSESTLAMIGYLDQFGPSVAQRHETLSNESFFRNVLSMGFRKAFRRRLAGKVAGMAALGLGVDERIHTRP
jgi:hypothetical protein